LESRGFLSKRVNDQQQIRDDRYALDFALPIGTEVIAAKDGRVLSKADNISTCYTGNQREIGLLAEVNYIVLYHSRSECTLYRF
jgi:murein DD-endopeptidase MepM/ murein hydrolase activator NlpD